MQLNQKKVSKKNFLSSNDFVLQISIIWMRFHPTLLPFVDDFILYVVVCRAIEEEFFHNYSSVNESTTWPPTHSLSLSLPSSKSR